jgi:folate-binding protein YgfZ
MFSPQQYAALTGGAGVLDRSSRGRLMLTGQDRRAYLQGLLTNDTAALTPGTGCYAAYLTAQGRMIADVRLFELGDALLADLEGHVVEPVRDRWSMFIFSEDVVVTDVTATTAQVGVYGPRAAATLATVLDGAHGAAGPSAAAEQLDAMPLLGNGRWDFRGSAVHVLRRDDAGVMGFDVVLPEELKQPFIDSLHENGAVSVDPAVVEVRRVEAGIPVFGTDMTEDTIPLEAGIEDRAISLTKGCYVGQEIIIRVLHRGHGRVAKRLVGLTLEAGNGLPKHGAKIASGDREIGSITSAVDSPSLGHPIALGYVHRDFVEPGTRLIVKGPEREMAATVTLLPFSNHQP